MQGSAETERPRGLLGGGMPPSARVAFRNELSTTLFFAVTLAAVEGGIASAYAKNTFAGVAPERTLNFVVAMIGSAPEFANILSFIWLSAAHAKPKVPVVNSLQLAVVLSVAALALAPVSPLGLAVTAVLMLLARVCWSGIITIRPTLWRANYPREHRAWAVGRFSTVQTLTVAVAGIGIGLLLDQSARNYLAVAPACAAVGVIAVLVTRRLRVRRQRAMLQAEVEGPPVGRPWQGPAIVWRVLRKDRYFALFMGCMFTLGLGNLMLMPMMVIALKDQFGASYTQSILITTTIPYILMPMAIPLWTRLLDRAHVVKFRSIHSWVFALSTALFGAGVGLHRIELLFAAAVVHGIGFGGGTLAWNLGHVDFAPPSQTSQYMATHVTLNGVRGLIGPLLAVFLYEQARQAGLSERVGATAVLSLSTLLCVLGALGFVALRRTMGSAASAAKRTTG
ncbi:MAG: MFS transporter [Phycisphaerales bacterium]|nr:MFS transporter [Phycisphaerales bacterium]